MPEFDSGFWSTSLPSPSVSQIFIFLTPERASVNGILSVCVLRSSSLHNGRISSPLEFSQTMVPMTGLSLSYLREEIAVGVDTFPRSSLNETYIGSTPVVASAVDASSVRCRSSFKSLETVLTSDHPLPFASGAVLPSVMKFHQTLSERRFALEAPSGESIMSVPLIFICPRESALYHPYGASSHSVWILDAFVVAGG